MPPITIKMPTRRRVVAVLYALYCWAVSAAVIGASGGLLKTVGAALQGLSVALIVWGLVVLWGSCASTTVGPEGIGQRWPGVRRTIPWEKVDDVAVVRLAGFKPRRQVRVSLRGGRRCHLVAPVDGLRKPTNPDFDQEAARIVDHWESVRLSSGQSF